MLVQLIKACSNQSDAIYDKWMLPLELCSLATYLQKTIPDIEVEILDGQVKDAHTVLSEINPSAAVTGITYTIFSISSMEAIAEAAKGNGSYVVVGGHAATASAENLLSNPNIDAVIKYDGEIPLSLLVEKLIKNRNETDFHDIPNIVFRRGSEIKYGPATEIDIGMSPTPLRELNGVNILNYLNAYPHTCSEKKLIASRPTNAYSKKGCPRSCSFCGRVDKRFRSRSAETVYREYAQLGLKYKIDYIYDHSDTWIDPAWMNEFENAYNTYGPLGLRYMVFGDVRDINKEVAKQMSNLGVDIILLGLESGSECLLHDNGKSMTTKQMKDCISMLAGEDIKVSASFVLGMMGENQETIKETTSFISDIKELGDVTIYCNLNIPLPGSWQWKTMMQDHYLESLYGHEYSFDIDHVRTEYLKRFTDVPGGLPQLTEIRNTIIEENNMPILEYAR